MLELIKNIEIEDKQELEQPYGVEFHADSIRLCCLIITSYCDDFNEAINHDKERILKEQIVKILDASCQRLATSNLPKVEDVDGSDIEYLLHRACVELAAIRLEKERVYSQLWISHSMSQTRVQELVMLKQVHEELVSYLKDEKAIKEVGVSTRMFQNLDDLRAKILLSINREFKQILTVNESDIVEAARRILRIPAPLSSKFFKPNYEDLENTEDDSTIHPDVRQYRENLIDAVNKMPSSVILLRNRDKAHASANDFLLEILRNGKIADENGKRVDFTKMLIIMTSNVLCNLDSRRRWKIEDAKQHFKPELLEIIDNMIVFKLLLHPEFRALWRLRIRKLAYSIREVELLYIHRKLPCIPLHQNMNHNMREHLNTYLEKNVVPELLKICNQYKEARSIVYVDTVVGTNALSYRVENDRCLTGDQEFGHFLAYLCEFWNSYKREMLWLLNINGLQKTLQFIDQTKTSGDPLPLEPLACKIRKLLTSENSLYTIPKNLPMRALYWALLSYAGHNQHGLGCPRRVGMRPGSVVLIDQVEKAPMSVFSGLISLLDYRFLTYHNGACMIDLRVAIIIMVSDLGNRDFILEMFEEASKRTE
ncbi:hypothetical protein PTKIN_Ptkin18bG0133800 [Pterospermum kingtungense]